MILRAAETEREREREGAEKFVSGSKMGVDTLPTLGDGQLSAENWACFPS